MQYEVTATLTIEADSAAEAIDMFDAEYRDTYNVVHLCARVRDYSTGVDSVSPRHGERRNGQTVVR